MCCVLEILMYVRLDFTEYLNYLYISPFAVVGSFSFIFVILSANFWGSALFSLFLFPRGLSIISDTGTSIICDIGTRQRRIWCSAKSLTICTVHREAPQLAIFFKKQYDKICFNHFAVFTGTCGYLYANNMRNMFYETTYWLFTSWTILFGGGKYTLFLRRKIFWAEKTPVWKNRKKTPVGRYLVPGSRLKKIIKPHFSVQ